MFLTVLGVTKKFNRQKSTIGDGHELQKIFVHFGAHKTGTKYLQDNLNKNSKFFRKRKSYFTHPVHTDQPIKKLIEWQKGDWENEPMPKEFVDYLRRFKTGRYESVFLSSESLLGRMNLMVTKTLCPTNKKVMQLIKDEFADKEIKVAFSIRSYPEFIESSYNWLIKHECGFTFEKFQAGIEINKISWVPIIENMLEIFGHENVYLWEYESYKKDSTKINLNLLRFLYGEVGNREITFSKKRVNESLNKKTLEATQKINKAISELTELEKSEKKALKRNLGRAIYKTGLRDTEKPHLLDDAVRRRLNKRYEKDIKEIEKIYGRSITG